MSASVRLNPLRRAPRIKSMSRSATGRTVHDRGRREGCRPLSRGLACRSPPLSRLLRSRGTESVGWRDHGAADEDDQAGRYARGGLSIRLGGDRSRAPRISRSGGDLLRISAASRKRARRLPGVAGLSRQKRPTRSRSRTTRPVPSYGIPWRKRLTRAPSNSTAMPKPCWPACPAAASLWSSSRGAMAPQSRTRLCRCPRSFARCATNLAARIVHPGCLPPWRHDRVGGSGTH